MDLSFAKALKANTIYVITIFSLNWYVIRVPKDLKKEMKKLNINWRVST